MSDKITPREQEMIDDFIKEKGVLVIETVEMDVVKEGQGGVLKTIAMLEQRAERKKLQEGDPGGNSQLQLYGKAVEGRALRISKKELEEMQGASDLKHCNSCDKDKPHSEFYANKTNKDGLDSYCKECRKEKVSACKKKQQKGVIDESAKEDENLEDNDTQVGTVSLGDIDKQIQKVLRLEKEEGDKANDARGKDEEVEVQEVSGLGESNIPERLQEGCDDVLHEGLKETARDSADDEMPKGDDRISPSYYTEMAISPAEYAEKNHLSFIEGNVVKYISRHGQKNGAEDVFKAIKYCQLELEWKYGIKTEIKTQERC